MAINLNALGAETPWSEVTVTQDRIDALCSCLGDYNPLFLDPETAAQSAAVSAATTAPWKSVRATFSHGSTLG